MAASCSISTTIGFPMWTANWSIGPAMWAIWTTHSVASSSSPTAMARPRHWCRNSVWFAAATLPAMWKCASLLAPQWVQCYRAGFRIVLDGGTRWWHSSQFRPYSVGATWWRYKYLMEQSPGLKLQLSLHSNCHLYKALQQAKGRGWGRGVCASCVCASCVCAWDMHLSAARILIDFTFLFTSLALHLAFSLYLCLTLSLSLSLSHTLFVHRWHFGLLNIGGHVHVATCYNWIRIDDRDCC